MGKLVELMFMAALNGLITAPQEWSPPYWDDEHAAYATKLLSEADALLLGPQDVRGLRGGVAAAQRRPLLATASMRCRSTLHRAR